MPIRKAKVFEDLWQACERRKLSLVVRIESKRPVLVVLAGDKAIDTQPVRNSEMIDDAARKLMSRMKKDGIVK